jgi:hypothetical protein
MKRSGFLSLFLAGPIALLSRGLPVCEAPHPLFGPAREGSAGHIMPMTFNNPYEFDIFVRYGSEAARLPSGKSVTLPGLVE